jgi:hypothetical protein
MPDSKTPSLLATSFFLPVGIFLEIGDSQLEDAPLKSRDNGQHRVVILRVSIVWLTNMQAAECEVYRMKYASPNSMEYPTPTFLSRAALRCLSDVRGPVKDNNRTTWFDMTSLGTMLSSRVDRRFQRAIAYTKNYSSMWAPDYNNAVCLAILFITVRNIQGNESSMCILLDPSYCAASGLTWERSKPGFFRDAVRLGGGWQS